MSADDYRAESVLLLDNALIEQQRGIRREVQVGRKSGVLMEPDPLPAERRPPVQLPLAVAPGV